MCFIERNDIRLWVNAKGFRERLIFCLPMTSDEKGYEDYFTVELPDPGGSKVIYDLPFRVIRDMTCTPPKGDGHYTIRLELTDEDLPLLELRVPTHCYSYFGYRKMEKTYRKRRGKVDAGDAWKN